jgi:hypothetical protein
VPTNFSQSSQLPADPAAVWAVLVDPAFLVARAERSGALGHEESVTREAATTVVTTSRTVGTERLPQAASRFLGATAVVEQVERWAPADPDGSRRGELTLTIRSAPVELTATVTLTPVPTGSTHDLTGSLSVRVPLLGGSVEKAALPGLLDLVRSEVELAREWLTR